MSEQPRDWDRELADIDRVIAKQGSAPSTGPGPTPAIARPAGPVGPAGPGGPAPVRRRSVALTWFWVALAVALAVALGMWPYRRECGLQLFFYLGAAGVAVVVGLLAALASWSHRRGVAHVLALLTLAWAGAIVTSEVLPRIGYARVDRTWTCAASPAADVTAGQGTSAPGAPRAGPSGGAAAPASAPSAGPSGSGSAGGAPSSGTDLQSTTTPSQAPAGGAAGAPSP